MSYDVDTDIHLRAAYSLLQFLDHARDPNAINISSFDHLKPTAYIIAHIAFGAYDWGSKASMNRCVPD
jgi:hypothetical protein